MSGSEAFRLADVQVRFGGKSVLDGIDLGIATAESVAVIGPSGGGKTTLFKLLNSTVAPSKGQVFSLGSDLSTVKAKALRNLRSNIALIPQDLALVPNIRVIQNVIMGRFGSRGLLASARDFLYPADLDTDAIYQLLARIGIGEKLYHRTETLSGGQQQRVAIARALFSAPKAILADEPVSNVDPARAEDSVRLLTTVSSEDSITLIMALHNVELALKYFPRIIAIKHGRVIFDAESGDVSELMIADLYNLTESELIENG